MDGTPRCEDVVVESRSSGSDVETLFAAALRLHQTMQLNEAEARYKQVLARDPRHAGSLRQLGALAVQSGRFSLADELLAEAIRYGPEDADAHYTRGVALQHMGRAGEAATLYRKAIALNPAHAEAYNNLGVALSGTGGGREALSTLQKAVAIRPNYADAHFNLGHELEQLGRYDEAEAAYRRAIELKPDNALAYCRLGVVLQRAKRGAEAVAAFQRGIELNPQDARAYHNLGYLLNGLDRSEEAVAAYRRAIELEPGFPDSHVSLAATLQHRGDAPTSEVMASIDRALAVSPAHAQAWFARSEIKTFKRDDPEIEHMQRLLSPGAVARMPLEDRVFLEFALGKAWMDIGDPKAAFDHLDAANRLKRASFPYEVEVDIKKSEAIVNTFSAKAIREMAGSGDPSSAPIFVVGMPRSGTSLIEQILGSHPDIHGAGELTILNDLVDRFGREPRQPGGAILSPEALAALGRAYVEQVTALAPTKARVVNKLPGNFIFAGLIHVMLPNARIIHCRRDAVDTCLSCYTKKFSEQLNYCYDLRELGLFYRSYAAAMEHWRRVLPPNRFIDVDYEGVVGDLEAHARWLIAFCGLEWNEACLDFHNTRRQVRTASAHQVRQPIYQSSVGRWKPYRQRLAPLLEALGRREA